MEAGAEAEPLLPPRRWRTGRGLWRERGGARSAEDGECPGRAVPGAPERAELSPFPQNWGAPGSRKGRKPPGLLRGSAALPGLLPAALVGAALREPLALGSGASLALLLQPQAPLVPYVIIGFSSKALTSFPRTR